MTTDIFESDAANAAPLRMLPAIGVPLGTARANACGRSNR